MNLTFRFSHPLYLATFAAVLLLAGWAIGAQWGHSASAGYALFWTIVALLIHDFAIAALAGIGGYKFVRHLRNKDWR